MVSESEAWAKLEQAIEVFLGDLGQPGLLMDWVLVAHKLEANADGSNSNSTTYVGSEFQPMYRTLGLLKYAAQIIEGEIEESRKGGVGDDGDVGF